MERSETVPLFPEMEIFGDIMEGSSFNERFDSQDFREILNQQDSQIMPFKEDTSLDIWNNLDSEEIISDDIVVKTESLSEQPTFIATKKMVQLGDAIYFVDDSSSGSSQLSRQPVMVIDADTSSAESNGSLPAPSLSLQPWNGIYEFTLGVQTSNYSNSKWAYSTLLKKLFLRPFDAVPVEVKVSQWIEGYINITPVYVSSQHKSLAVNRCHNHKISDEDKKLPNSDHIVQVDNSDAKYRLDGLRHSVDIPLGVPAPGESGKLLYVKCGCWNTCTGGPSRKPFCLVFTLFTRSGEEIGRQILNLKVCACPVRDCGYSEKKFLSKENTSKVTGKGKLHGKKKINSPAKGVKKVKAEPTEQTFEQITIPSEFALEVKRCVNRLFAEKYAKENNIFLPFQDC